MTGKEQQLGTGDGANGGAGYLYHDPCHSPMKLQDPMKTVKALVGNNVLKNDPCCGESGTLGVTRPDIATQIRFRKEKELRKGETDLRAMAKLPEKSNVKILTSCPSCLQQATGFAPSARRFLSDKNQRRSFKYPSLQ